jgi:hypothetical protein
VARPAQRACGASHSARDLPLARRPLDAAVGRPSMDRCRGSAHRRHHSFTEGTRPARTTRRPRRPSREKRRVTAARRARRTGTR